MLLKKLNFIFLFCSSLLLYQKANSQEVQILFPHLYFGNEIDLSLQNRDWIGLYNEENQFSLKPAEVTITLARHDMTDDEGEKTGKLVNAIPEKPFMLISGLDRTISGSTQHSGLHNISLSPGDTISFNLHEKNYQIIADGETNELGYIKQYQVFLQSEYRQQLIGESDFLDDTAFRILWAGDLDGDQELDLLMDLSYKYSFGLFSLFLSSKKQDGQLLQLTTQHRMYYD